MKDINLLIRTEEQLEKLIENVITVGGMSRGELMSFIGHCNSRINYLREIRNTIKSITLNLYDEKAISSRLLSDFNSIIDNIMQRDVKLGESFGLINYVEKYVSEANDNFIHEELKPKGWCSIKKICDSIRENPLILDSYGNEFMPDISFILELTNSDSSSI